MSEEYDACCGCHWDCTHDCEVPCVWPYCLTDADRDRLDADLAAEERAVMDDDDGYDPDEPLFGQEPGAILTVVATCPGCGLVVLTSPGTTVTRCAQHGGSGP